MAENSNTSSVRVLASNPWVRVVLNHAQEDHTPLFDWQCQMTAAEEIIAYVVTAKVHSSAANQGREKPGLNMSKYQKSIARLLAKVAEDYLVALDDFEIRSDPVKPKRRLTDNYDRQLVDVEHDYGDSAGAGFEDWEENWDMDYGRGRGNPGTNRSSVGGPPLSPARLVYFAVRDWWRLNELGKFHPTFRPFPGEDEYYDELEFNAPSRFLLSVLRYVNADYTAKNARSLYETIRKSKKSR